jgi:hypothetical protein
MLRLTITVAVLVGLSLPALGYGNRGHRMVGAIADRRLQQNPTVRAKVHVLLSGLTLETVAVYPDTIIKPLDNTATRNVFSRHPELSGKRSLVKELTAFWQANHDFPLPRPHENRHRMAHYTDVPVMGTLKYQDGGVGQQQYDIVHAIPRCIRILQAEATSDDDERQISKAVAVVLLAHYVGDIHQPLHVGAEYFNHAGQPVDPVVVAGALADTGGNDIHFRFHPPHHSEGRNLHAFWDEDAVDLAFPGADDATYAKDLATSEPAGWQPAAGVDISKWAEVWANEILPVARDAHTAATFDGIATPPQGKPYFQAELNGSTYPDFAGKSVKTAIHKAGWRLAAVLEAALKD